MTKREKLQIIWAYKVFRKNRGKTLYTAYEKPSQAKQIIWDRIESSARMTKGYNYDLTIITKNTFMFTCGYTVSDEQNKFVYFTPSRDYEILTSEINEWIKQYGLEMNPYGIQI